MKDPKDKEILQSMINRGNLAEIALKETLNGYVARKRSEKLASLVADFNSGKTPGEMINTIASLAALTDMENDLVGQISRKNTAIKKLGEIENDEATQGYREY